VAQSRATAPRRAAAPPTAPHPAYRVIQGDCVSVLAGLARDSVDAVVTDPPYGIDFQGAHWDGRSIRQAATQRAGRCLAPGEAYQAWCTQWAAECARVMRPGAHLVGFGSPRTAHRLACALEDAGLQLRDTLMWLYGTGMPKSRRLPGGRSTALKPAYEPILLARKPLQSTTPENLAHHGTGALNAAACSTDGRYPANVLAAHAAGCRRAGCAADCPLRLIDESAARTRTPSASLRQASRVFYCPKASRTERDAGCQALPRRPLDLFPNAQRGQRPAPARNPHPTVKPLALMRWLIALTTPEGGLVVDPFCGSGSTGAGALLEHRRFIGVELEPSFAAIARARLAHWAHAEGSDEAGERRPLRPPPA
jgi:site-specific DNA-methyltransferase (adenine-specific)